MSLFFRIASTFFVFLFFLNSLEAQLCQGSLGDPLINITFGSGGNPGAPLRAATTSYQYVSTDCPNDGFYTVRNNTNSCFGSTWHTVNSDHTGDPNGYFMLINASFQPSAFYLDTVRGLCSGTTYEFAAWVINVLKTSACSPNPTQPNLTFTLERTNGTVLQTYNTNTINSQASPTWQQFGFYFTTPVNVTDIVVRIFNNAPGGCGNDLGLDDITFRPCGPQLGADIIGSASDTVTVCEGNARSFNFTGKISAGFNNPSFQWQQCTDGRTWTDIPAATTMQYSKNFPSSTAPAKYMYRLSSAEAGNMGSAPCRIASTPLMIEVAPNPVTTANSNGPLCANKSLQLNASGGTQYQWSGVNNFSAATASVSIDSAQPAHSGKYHVLVTSSAGCTHLDSVTVAINPNPVANLAFDATTICEGEAVKLESSGGSSYQWIPATGLSSDVVAAPIAAPTSTIEYNVIVSNQFSCSDTAKVKVNVMEAPRADAGQDKWIMKGASIQLAANATGENISYSWSPAVFINDPQSLQPIVNPPRDTSYVLNVLSGCGTAADTMKVFVYNEVFVPSAFSPNNDGLNDTWNIPALNAFPGFELTVFNRQGQVIYQNKNGNIPWDGKYKGEPQPVAVYIYMIDLKVPGGFMKGTVTIVR